MEHASPIAIIMMILLVGPVAYYISRAKKNYDISVRRIPGIDAIDEAIGRSVELGRGISFTSGLTGISPLLYACLGSLRYIARRSAVYRSRFFVPCSDPEALALTQATVQNAYKAESRGSSYEPSSIRFLSEDQFAYAAGYMGLTHRENVGAAFLFGHFAAESLILAEAGQQIGAIQVAATTDAAQVPFFITACDYTLIGEELYAAGAYLSKDPVQTGSLRGQDIAKSVIVGLVLLGVIGASLGQAGVIENKNPVKSVLETKWADLFPSMKVSEEPKS